MYAWCDEWHKERRRGAERLSCGTRSLRRREAKALAALNDASKCKCRWGGTVNVMDAGQTTAGTD
jgi:hypothetical protein